MKLSPHKNKSLVVRALGLCVSGLLDFQASAAGFYSIYTDLELSIGEAFARNSVLNNPVVGEPIQAKTPPNSPGYSTKYRGGIRNDADLKELERAEYARFLQFAKDNPEVLDANMSPDPIQGGGSSAEAGESDTGESGGGIKSGLSFLEMHSGSMAPTSNEMGYANATWSRSSSGSPGMNGGGGNSTTSTGFPAVRVEAALQASRRPVNSTHSQGTLLQQPRSSVGEEEATLPSTSP